MSSFMIAMISAVHVFSCIALIVSILLQSGKGGGLAGAFGAGSSQTLFGGRGAATFLTRASTALAVVFFVTSLTLDLTSTRQTTTAGRSLMQEEARRRAEQRGTAEQGTTGSTAPGTTAPGSTTPGTMGPGGTTPGTQAPATAMPAPGTAPARMPAAPPTQGSVTPQKSGTK